MPCDMGFSPRLAAVKAGHGGGRRSCRAFCAAGGSGVSRRLRRCAELHAATHYPPAEPVWRPRDHARIRLGYFAGEYRVHATAHLTARLAELHDRARFEVVAFDTGVGDGSAMRARLEAGFDRWIDIKGMDDAAAAARIAAEEIDILVNLSGYVGEAGTGVFARRPALVQVNDPGFPATLGAPYIDYIVADPVVIPPDEALPYTEQVAWLPHTTR